MSIPGDKFFNERALRTILGISSSTLYRWVKNGKFPYPYKMRHNLNLWDKIEVNNWLNNKKQI